MHIDYRLHQFSADVSGYHLITDTHGKLEFLINGETYLSVEVALVMEFARCVYKWLTAVDSGEWLDFYYASMDEEEEPIISFTLQRDSYTVYSCWSDVSAPPFSKDEIYQALADFLSALKGEVAERYGVDLDVRLAEKG